MESPNYNSWTINQLKELLLKHNISDKDIKKSGKSKSKPLKSDYIRAIKKINKKNDININKYEKELTDVIPTIMQNLDPMTLRSINKGYYQQYNNKEIIYQFILKNIPFDAIDDVDDYFDNYEIFKKYQYEQVQKLDEEQIQFLLYYIYLINTDSVEQMDNASMEPYKSSGFMLYDNNILVYTQCDKADGKLGLTNSNPNNKSHITSFIYRFITQDDYDRFVELYYEENDITPLSKKEFQQSQVKMVNRLGYDMIQFLNYYMYLIRIKKIKFSNAIFDGFYVDGFIFLDGRLVAYNNR